MSMATTELYETKREEIATDFFRYLHDFSNGGWCGGEYRQQGDSSPHLLREEFHHQDRYLNALFSMARQLLQNACEDSGVHRYTRPNISMRDLVNLVASSDEKKPASQWSKFFPEVEQIISAHGPEVRQAFQTLFDTCRAYEKSVEDTQAHTITQEVHGITEEQADRLHDALLKIWQAYPETDTRISEGFDYAMHDSAARKVFTFPSPIGGASGYVFGESGSENRSDYRLAEMLEKYDGKSWKRLDAFGREQKIQPGQVAAIAAQSIKNLEKLEAFSVPVAERCLAKFIDTVSKDGHGDAVAKKIFQNLTSGKTTIEEEAKKIREGNLAGGYTNWLQKDDKRLMALAVVSGVESYLKFCADIRSGEWFKQERSKIATLCAEKNLPGFSSRSATAAPQPL